MPLWHKDDFELKAIEKTQMQEKLSALPCLPESRAQIYKVFSLPPLPGKAEVHH